MSSSDAGDIVYDAIESERIDEGRARLDAWQASQPEDLDTLASLRHYRPLLGQYHEAIVAAKAMIAIRPHHAWERMSDHLRLGELYVAVGKLDDAWNAVGVVLAWTELPDWLTAGLARHTVELALDISAASRPDSELSGKALDAAVKLLDGGCSTSLVILEKVRDCSERLSRPREFERFKRAAAENYAEIQRQLER